MKIWNPCNAFLRIESGDTVLLCDPWLTDGIYEGGWGIYPPLTKPKTEYLNGATHVFISHIHADHFDVDTLQLLPRSVTILLPKVFPNHIMQMELAELGFSDIRMLEPSVSTVIAGELVAEVIAPMNGYAQELEYYLKQDDFKPSPTAIDSGLYLTDGHVRAVFLADNSPYDPRWMKTTLEKARGCDLLAFPYNGAASDYPLCYTNLQGEKGVQISNEREEKRANSTDAFIQLLRPKSLMPYSSDFAVCGPMAKAFVGYMDCWWADKAKVADRYEKEHKLPCLRTSEHVTFQLHKGGVEEARSDFKVPALSAIIGNYYSEQPKTLAMYSSPELSELEKSIKLALGHLQAAAQKNQLSCDRILQLVLRDRSSESPFVVDFENFSFSREVPPGRLVISCILDSGYLFAILGGQSHWNNAQLSFQLGWTREPNIYSHEFYMLLNFFHIPRALWKKA